MKEACTTQSMFPLYPIERTFEGARFPASQTTAPGPGFQVHGACSQGADTVDNLGMIVLAVLWFPVWAREP